MAYDLIIVGAGGFGREIRQLIPASFPDGSMVVKGFLSSNPRDLDGYDVSEPVLDDPMQYQPAENDRFLLAIGDVASRRRVVESLRSRGAKFVSLVHPTAYVDPGAKYGEGCVLYPFSTLMNAARLGDFVSLSIYASAGHDSQIGDYCNLSPYATLNGFSVLESDVFMGTHSSVAPRRRVGEGSKISSNSSVAHDVAPRTLVFGVPGKHVPLR